ncbi:MAG: BrnT family toxin [Candidatus Chisholmbacteria bacterium]|nr:BrnT family toxin [Candidatus Chisholmbacteria bacterium]
MAVSLSRLKPLSFDWDNSNKDKNWHKHRVKFRECEQIFSHTPIKIFPDPKHSQAERRFLAYGVTGKSRKLAIIFTIRNKQIRIISARDQNKKERQVYEEK